MSLIDHRSLFHIGNQWQGLVHTGIQTAWKVEKDEGQSYFHPQTCPHLGQGSFTPQSVHMWPGVMMVLIVPIEHSGKGLGYGSEDWSLEPL